MSSGKRKGDGRNDGSGSKGEKSTSSKTSGKTLIPQSNSKPSSGTKKTTLKSNSKTSSSSPGPKTVSTQPRSSSPVSTKPSSSASPSSTQGTASPQLQPKAAPEARPKNSKNPYFQVSKQVYWYMRKAKSDELKTIENSYKVTILPALSDQEICIVKNGCNEKLMNDAIEEFATLVQGVVEKCTSVTFTLRDGVASDRDKLESILKEQDHPLVHVEKDIDSPFPKLIFHGENQHIQELSSRLSDIAVTKRPSKNRSRAVSLVEPSSSDGTHEDCHLHRVAKQVYLYMRKVKSKELKAIEASYKVTISPASDLEVCIQKGKDCDEKLMNEAIEEFTTLVQVVVGKCTSVTFPIRDDVTQEEVDSLLEDNDHPMVYVEKALSHSDPKLILHGEDQHVQKLRARLNDIAATQRPHRRAVLKESHLPPDPCDDLKLSYSHQLHCGTLVTIQKGNIVEENVDIIVNPANVYLKHGGGLAYAIAKAAGSEFRSACKELVRKRPLQIGDAKQTKAGKLKCKWVIHACGPYVKLHDHEKLLAKTIKNVFDTCMHLKAKSVVIPAISTGIFGISNQVCAKVMMKAIKKNVDENKANTLKDIRILDIDVYTVLDFISVFEKKWPDDQSNIRPLPSRDTDTCRSSNETADGRSTATDKINLIDYHASPEDLDAHAKNNNDGENGDNKGSAKKRQSKRGIAGDAGEAAGGDSDEDDNCPICLCEFTNKYTLKKCKHSFCKECLDRAIENKNACPICNDILGMQKGNQPNGTMDVHKFRQSLSGFEGYGTIQIDYHFPSGTQTDEHPNPGTSYHGTSRTGFLPDNQEGNEVLEMLAQAFKSRLTFTIGRSNTTGRDNCVIWNDIHHKTSMQGGPTNFGYPDPTYLARVKDELAAKGITCTPDTTTLSTRL